MNSCRAERAFSLLECCVALAMAALMVGISGLGLSRQLWLLQVAERSLAEREEQSEELECTLECAGSNCQGRVVRVVCRAREQTLAYRFVQR